MKYNFISKFLSIQISLFLLLHNMWMCEGYNREIPTHFPEMLVSDIIYIFKHFLNLSTEQQINAIQIRNLKRYLRR